MVVTRCDRSSSGHGQSKLTPKSFCGAAAHRQRAMRSKPTPCLILTDAGPPHNSRAVNCEVAIVGAGPGGLAAGIESALRGFSTVVFDRQTPPIDKACGEGLMPKGYAALERLGVTGHLDARDCARFTAIRYVQEDGSYVDGRLAPPGGLGIRRLALSAAMAERAREVGVRLEPRCGVRSPRVRPDGVELDTDAGVCRAQLLVVADGLHSPIRKALGFQAQANVATRFGMRRHYQRSPWGDAVEVHFSNGVEAYVTPAGAARVGIAFLWEDGRAGEHPSFETLLERFPALKLKVSEAPVDSEARGAGPLFQRVSGRVADRVVLLGDAAGYVDAITGEGLSLAFDAAHVLGELLPTVLPLGATAASLAPYAHAVDAEFREYARLAQSLLFVARRPLLRRFVLNRMVSHPVWFERTLQHLTSQSRWSGKTAAGPHPRNPAAWLLHTTAFEYLRCAFHERAAVGFRGSPRKGRTNAANRRLADRWCRPAL
jgi:flavin-dependent dehydrogenase